MLYAWQSNHLFNYYFDSVTKGTRFLLAATAVLSFVEFDVLLLLFLIWSVVLFFLSKEISWTLFLFFSDFGDGVGSSRTRFKSFSSKFSSLEDFGLEMVINCNLLGLGLPPSFKLRILISAGLQTPSLFNGMPENSLFFKKDELKWGKLALLILDLKLGKVLQGVMHKPCGQPLGGGSVKCPLY